MADQNNMANAPATVLLPAGGVNPQIVQLKHRIFVVGAQLEAQQAIARGTILPESSLTGGLARKVFVT